MGYTHYWEQSRDFSKTEWLKIKKSAKEIFDSNKGIVFNWEGKGSPEITDKSIRFNGNSDTGDDHETFELTKKKEDFSFCKTARKPYDAVVVKVLSTVRKIAPDAIRLSSDGGKDIFD